MGRGWGGGGVSLAFECVGLLAVVLLSYSRDSPGVVGVDSNGLWNCACFGWYPRCSWSWAKYRFVDIAMQLVAVLLLLINLVIAYRMLAISMVASVVAR